MNQELLANSGEEFANDESHYQSIRVYRTSDGFCARVSSHGGAGAGGAIEVQSSSLRGLHQELHNCDIVCLVDWDAFGEIAPWRKRRFQAEFRQQFEELVFRAMNRLF